MRRHVTILCVAVAAILATQTGIFQALAKPPQPAPEETSSPVKEPSSPVDETTPRLIRVTINFVYDNYAFSDEFTTNWGFACVVGGTEKTILFDTGQKGDLLLENFEKMGLDIRSPEVVVLSHNHEDHTGGLAVFLGKNHDVSVYVPASFPREFVQEVEMAGAKIVSVTTLVKICENVFLTGEIGGPIKEQGLILDRGDGLMLITGCAHPGIVEMTKGVKKSLKKDVAMVLGGFHLNQLSESAAKSVADELKELGVREIGATHCTGDKAIAAFEETFGENFLRLGVGKTLAIGESGP